MRLHPDDLAYVLFTSGSTGRPKGVAISHRSIVNRLLWMQDTYPLTVDDVVLQKTPATFDVSVWELFWPLLTGASVVLASPDGHRDPRYLSRIIDEYDVTTLHFVPSMLEVFLAGADLGRCGSIRQVFTSGEALPATTVARFADSVGAALHNLYGPTEAAVDVTAHPTVAGENPVPIGAPVWNTTVRVLDSRLQPVPVGVEGELYLGGVQLARGYHAAPGLTAGRFVADPSGPARLYRTGDVVRWRTDGVLEYVGRSDFQVKLRGQRIELGEIESALLEHDAVAQAVVALHRDNAAGEHLVAYVVGAVDSETVLAHAAARLPRHMVPTVAMVLEALPVTSNGKLDRKALPAPEFGSGAEYVAPATATEETVAAIVADVLGRDGLGATANFFDLGGNSLTATRLLARLDDTFGTRLQIRDLFDNATVGGLSTLIDRQQDRQVGPALVAGPRPEHIPLSPAQARMWFVNRFDPGSGAYNVAVALRLTGTLDIDALRSAVTGIVDRHETLRTLYPDHGDGPRQEILSVADALDALPLTVEDVHGTLDEPLLEVVARGFDVTREIPLALEVLREDADRHVLALVVHHIAIDGWSMQVLARDLVAAYGARSAGAAPAWEPLPVGYADYALWQQGLLGSTADSDSVAARQLAFWRDALAGAPEVLDLRADHRRPAVPSFRGGTVRIRDTLGVAVPLQWLFSHSTVEALSQRIDQGETTGPEFAMLQPIREQGGLPPLFCVHPIVGLSWCYTALVPHLDPSLPVYGLQTPLDDLPETLDDLAARYVEEIRRVQEHGPYRLLGWSLGGVIAQAMAVQLQAAGETVESLVMLDSFAGAGLDTGTGDAEETVPMADLLAGFGFETDDTGPGSTEPGSIEDLVRMVAELTGNTADATDKLVRKLAAAAEHNATLAGRHRPSLFDGDVLYFSAGEDGRGGATGWADAVSGRVHDRSVPVTHWRMTSPDALAVAGPVLRTVFASPSDDDRQGQFAR